jgi:adhesin transport system outer membrane protein
MIRTLFISGAALLMLTVARADTDFARVEWFAPGAENKPMQMHFASVLVNAPQAPQRDEAALAGQWPDLGVGMWPLQALVGQAMEHSPTIREAQANAQAATHDVSQAQSGLWPRVEFSANSPSANLDQSTTAATARAGANVVYNLVDFGKTRKQIAGREFQSLSLQDRLRTVRETAAFDTANAYLELIKHQRLEGIYNAHIDELQGLTNKLSEIVAVFAGRRSELTQAQTRLGQANDALLSVQAKKRQFKLELMRQIGSYTRLTSVPDALPLVPEEGASLLMDAVRTQHPAIRSAMADAAVARAQVDEARAAQKPQVDLVLSSQTGLDANGFAAPTQLYVTAKWVAFDGFGSKNNQQALQERALAAEARAGQILQEVEFNIQSAQSNYRSLSLRAKELTALLRDTDQVRKDYYDQWRELGRRSLLDVLTAESEHLSTQVSLATAQVDQVMAAVRMRHESGGFREWLLGDALSAPSGQGVNP